MKAVFISGLLTHLSDNIISFLDKSTDIYVHTWNIPSTNRWIIKLNRYKKYCNDIKIEISNPKFDKKLFSYFYSTYRAVNLIQNIDQYTSVIKFKPNVDGEVSYLGNLEYYFNKGYLQSKPLLKGIEKENCLYGSIYYQTMDERIFSGYPLAFKKMFHILQEEFIQNMYDLDNKCIAQYGENYEGSIFWKEWAEKKGVKLIQDIDLKIPNSKPWQQ